MIGSEIWSSHLYVVSLIRERERERFFLGRIVYFGLDSPISGFWRGKKSPDSKKKKRNNFLKGKWKVLTLIRSNFGPINKITFR